MSFRSNFILLGLTILLINVQSGGAFSITKAQEYLLQYGYLPATARSSVNSGLLDEKAWSNALKDFQSFSGLNTTGELNRETMELMLKPRCGVPDKIDFSNDYHAERYVILQAKWWLLNLTYNISRYSCCLDSTVVDETIAKAFDVWSEYTDLSFKSVDFNSSAHITIGFYVGDHDDNNPFDGRKTTGLDVLAHAFPPSSCDTQVHFDDAQDWIETHDFFQVAVHELGHALGLNHSRNNQAVMAPSYKKTWNQRLHRDDIAGIQALYGKKSIPVK